MFKLFDYNFLAFFEFFSENMTTGKDNGTDFYRLATLMLV